MSLYLIGLRGAGKSVAGAAAAVGLGVPFADADAEVERRAGASIAEIFGSRGETAFRAMEREATLELLQRDGLLVATGGGCVLDPEVRRVLGQRPGVIWLRAPVEELARRVRGSGRPCLTDAASDEEELERLLQQREQHYLACADRSVDTVGRTVQEVAVVIQQLWQQLSHHDVR